MNILLPPDGMSGEPLSVVVLINPAQCSALEVFHAIIGAINSFSKFLVLHNMKSFRSIFGPPCLALVNGFKKPYFASTRTFFHLYLSKRVIAW